MAHTFGTFSTRTSGTANPINAAGFAVIDGDTVVVLFLKVNGGTNRTGGAPTFAGVPMVQANVTQKAASSPEASCELWYITATQFGGPLPVGSWVCSIPNAGSLTVFYTLATGRAAPGGESMLDVAAGTNATSTNPNSGALTTTTDGDIGFIVCCNGALDFDPATPNQTGFGTGTGTPLGTFDDGAHGGGQEYHLQAAKGAVTPGWTFATSEDWGCVAAYFKEVPPRNINNKMRVKAGNSVVVCGSAG